MLTVACIPPVVPQDQSWVYPRRAIDWLEIDSDANEKRNGWSRTSRPQTEDELECMGEVGVEMFDGKVMSEEASVTLMVAALESRDVFADENER